MYSIKWNSHFFQPFPFFVNHWQPGFILGSWNHCFLLRAVVVGGSTSDNSSITGLFLFHQAQHFLLPVFPIS